MPGGCLKHGQQTVLVFSFNHLVKFQGKHRVVVISGFAGSDWLQGCQVPLSQEEGGPMNPFRRVRPRDFYLSPLPIEDARETDKAFSWAGGVFCK